MTEHHSNAEAIRWLRTLVPEAVSVAAPIMAVRAEGAWIDDEAGRRYLDLASGIGTLNVGHRPPEVVAAIGEQLDRFLHTCFSVAPYRLYGQVVERLIALTPGTFPKKGVLFNSGAEAVENAVKIARAATGRGTVLCFAGAFHGRTLLTLTLTSKVSTYKHGFGPFCPEVVRIPFPYCYRCPIGLEAADCGTACTALLDEAMEAWADPEDLAAVVIEPQLGEGGFVPAPPAFLHAIRKLCDRTGAVMVADEVQTGFGRTGRFFAVEHSKVVPDLVTVAKSLAGGLPLSAVVGRAELFDAIQPGGLGGTFGGNPLACAAALAVMDLMERDALPARAVALGERIGIRLESWQHRYPERIGETRGLGAMKALELVRDRDSKQPAPELATAWTHFCLEEGVLVLKAGIAANVVRLLPPLTITDTEMDEALDRMGRALDRTMMEG
jgi:4-aminobutyrate aminotransferase/(S)-3-amino-2-methylpropionate transaminase